MLSAKGKNTLLLFWSTVGVFGLLMLSAANFSLSSPTHVDVLGVQTSPEEERIYWQNIVKDHPTYRDGYIELAKIEAEMGDNVSSTKSLEDAKKIDPNSLNLLKAEVDLLSAK